MKARRDRLARVSALNQQLWRLEASRLAQLEQRLADIGAAERGAIVALDDLALDPQLPLARLQQLTFARKETETALQAQRDRALAQGRRAKQTEKLFERVDEHWRNAQEQEAKRQNVPADAIAPDVRAP